MFGLILLSMRTRDSVRDWTLLGLRDLEKCALNTKKRQEVCRKRARWSEQWMADEKISRPCGTETQTIEMKTSAADGLDHGVGYLLMASIQTE